jgi:hypothetical protein
MESVYGRKRMANKDDFFRYLREEVNYSWLIMMTISYQKEHNEHFWERWCKRQGIDPAIDKNEED